MDNITSRYNIIHHGREIITEAEQQNKQKYRPAFYSYLPVFIEPSEGSVVSHRLLMDSVLEKSKRVINEKSNGKHVSSAYFLMGRANYLKGHHYDAAEFFAYVANTYADVPKLRQEAWIWQARSLLQLGNYAAAVPVLDSVLTYAPGLRGSRAMAYATQAQLHLDRGEAREAILYLKGALEQKGDRIDKLRWHFLTAQLLEEEELFAEAMTYYKKVSRSNVSYEMAFQAELKKTLIESMSDRVPNSSIRRLSRMLRNDKNKEFKDQLYYFIGEAHLNNREEEDAIRSYKNSLAQNSMDRHQSTRSYLALADLYVAGENYQQAQLYYDSASTTLPPDFRQVHQVRRKLLSMDRLIRNVQLIEEKQLHVWLASMTPEAREVVLDSLALAQYLLRDAGKEFSAREGSRQQPANMQQASRQLALDRSFLSDNITSFADNRFYFNNPDAVGMGMSAFRRQWGIRELQDKWRLSNEQNLASSFISTEVDMNAEASIRLSGDSVDEWESFAKKFKEEIKAKLPVDGPSLQLSHSSIRSALEENAEIYRNSLNDVSSSIDTYENLLIQYHENEEVASWLYQLTQSLEDGLGNNYRDQLLRDFPSSLYSQILLDPLYFEKQEAIKKRSDQRYSEVYALYGEGEYDEVIRVINEERSGGNSHVQLEYLRALALGRTSTYKTLQQELESIVERYPADSLVTPLVKQQLEFILTHQLDFESREIALQDSAGVSPKFSNDSRLTPWPQLVIHSGPVVSRGDLEPVISRNNIVRPSLVSSPALPIRQRSETPSLNRGDGQTTFRDLSLLPDTGTYYFVIHVMHPVVNLAPSRFGLGQFNRSRYNTMNISHQLKAVNNESQLIYVGPFSTFEEVKIYEARITPLIDDIMKVPADTYQTFLITETVFGTLSDFGKIDDYFNFYIAQ